MTDSAKKDEYIGLARKLEGKVRFKLQAVAAFLMNEACNANIREERRSSASMAALSSPARATTAARNDPRKPKLASHVIPAWASFQVVEGSRFFERFRSLFPGGDAKLMRESLGQHGIVPRHENPKNFHWSRAYDGDIDFVIRPLDAFSSRPAAAAVAQGGRDAAAPAPAGVQPSFELASSPPLRALAAAAAASDGPLDLNAGEGVADWPGGIGIGAADLAAFGLGVADVEAWRARFSAAGGLDSEPVGDLDPCALGADDSDWPGRCESDSDSDSD